jgi:hypothetical protein
MAQVHLAAEVDHMRSTQAHNFRCAARSRPPSSVEGKNSALLSSIGSPAVPIPRRIDTTRRRRLAAKDCRFAATVVACPTHAHGKLPDDWCSDMSIACVSSQEDSLPGVSVYLLQRICYHKHGNGFCQGFVRWSNSPHPARGRNTGRRGEAGSKRDIHQRQDTGGARR